MTQSTPREAIFSQQQLSKEGREGQLAAELERMHQRIGGKGVGERGDGGVVARRLRQAATADRAEGDSSAQRGQSRLHAGAADRRRSSRTACRAPRPGRRSSCRRRRASRAWRACYRFPMWTVAQLGADLAAGTTTSRELVEQALRAHRRPGGRGQPRLHQALRRLGARRSRLRRPPAQGRRAPLAGRRPADLGQGPVRRRRRRDARRLEDPREERRRPKPTRPRWRACAPPARSSSAAPTWSSSRSAASASTRTSARRRIPTTGTTGRVPGRLDLRRRGGAGRRHVRDGARFRHARLDPAARGAVRRRRLQADRAPRAARRRVPALYTLDSIGPLANSVACCAVYDAILAGESPTPLPELPIKGLRLMLPRSAALDDLDTHVTRAFVGTLSAALARRARCSTEVKVPAVRPPGRVFQERRLRRRRGLSHPPALPRPRSPSTTRASPSACMMGRDMSARRLPRRSASLRAAFIARGRGARRAVRRDHHADRAVHRADDRRDAGERRGLLPLERPHHAQHRPDQLPRRLRGDAAVPRAGRAAGRPDGVRHGDERPAHARGGGRG